ncbi:MAG: PIG-L family deacetylase [Clostridiaceae bacterium]|nr:PIG-L family deacetylase [Clostridiaceae bacterium]
MLKKFLKLTLKYPLGYANYTFLNSYYRWMPKSIFTMDNMFGEEKKDVVVLAPHVDDETIGLGATLLKHKKRGDNIYCIYVSDGSGSLTEASKEEIIALRKKEAKQIQEKLNIKEIYFMDEPDGAVKVTPKLYNRLYKIIDDIKPNVIYTPFFIDGHNDHIETTKALTAVLKDWNQDFNNIFMYEINCPIVPILVNSVSIMDEDSYREKEKLLEEFESQQVMAFDGFMLLNKMKRFIPQKGYGAEVFVKVTVEEMIKIRDLLEEHKFSYNDFRQLSNRYNLLLGFMKGYSKKQHYSKEIEKILS